MIMNKEWIASQVTPKLVFTQFDIPHGNEDSTFRFASQLQFFIS